MLNVDKGPYGYFPMQLGQYLHKRELQVVRKLGVGGFSSVWLAKQSIKNEAGYRYLALKVLTTYAILVERKRRMHDIEMAWKMSRLPPSARKHPGYKHCSVPLFDVFSEESAHGLHYGIPSSVCSGSVYSLFRETSRHRGLPLGVAKRITKQVLMALDFLHTTLGVVHGDVHPGNVLLRLRASTSDIDQYLFLHPAETYEPMHLPMLSPQPFVTVRSQPLPLLGVDPSLCNLDVQLTDYGLAVRADTITPGTAPLINMHMRAPEQLLGLRWGQPLDVWEAGIMVLALLTQGGPFQPSEDVQTCLASMHALLGPFPAEFLRRCRDDGSKSMPIDKHAMFLLTRPPENPVPLEYWLAAVLDSPMSARDIADSSRFVRRCLAIDPTARPTTAELLEDPWLAT
ncbi:kinase-like protein [Trametes polyzona]|nr:kinase-like protein [Trametes polyzona]